MAPLNSVKERLGCCYHQAAKTGGRSVPPRYRLWRFDAFAEGRGGYAEVLFEYLGEMASAAESHPVGHLLDGCLAGVAKEIGGPPQPDLVDEAYGCRTKR